MAETWACTNAAYHADTARIGSTMLRTLLDSPARYHARYIAGTLPDKETPSKLLGTIVHTLLLEPELFDATFYVRPPGIDGRTTAGKAALAKLTADNINKRLVPAEVVDTAKAMVAAVRASPACVDLLADAQREYTVVWNEDDLPMKARADLFLERPDMDSDLILDLKTADDPTPEEWMRGGLYSPIAKWRYDLQGAHYTHGMQELTGRGCAFGVIVVGSTEPHDVYVYDLTPWLPIGSYHRSRAIHILRELRTSPPEDGWRRPEQFRVLQCVPSQWDYPEELRRGA